MEQDPIDQIPLEWLKARLERQLAHPVTAPGSDAVAKQVLARIPGDPGLEFAKKLRLTLRDGQMHSTVAIRSALPRAAVSFVAWRGSWQDLIGKRYGLYLSSFLSCMDRTSKMAGPLFGFLQIDAFIRVLAQNSLQKLEERLDLDVEYTYFPQWPPNVSADGSNGAPQVLILNRDLCSEEEKASLASLIGP
jgi:hypothetical protein